VRGFVLHPDAYTDLDEIWEFIATDSIQSADNFREEIFETFQNVVPFPHQGHRRSDLTSRPLRFTSLRDYLIAYTSEERPLVVIAVLHGSRDPNIIAAILRGRE
jgi:plasmid stabilization system protein ParE